MHSLTRCTVLLLLSFAAVPLFAADADLVTVTTSVSNIANRGGFHHGDVLITNNIASDVRVTLAIRIVYSDGTVQTLSGLGDPGVLPPGGGVALSANFAIPVDASLGPADFVAEVTATAAGGLQENETSSAWFLVLP
jgi:hypothetical protein